MHRLRMPMLALLVVSAALVLAACAEENGAEESARPTPSTSGIAVVIEGFAYSPATLTIEAGATVIWTNEDSVAHTVTSSDGPSTGAATTDLFDSGLMSRGDTFSHTFTEPGTYDYLCTPHRSMPSMHARVVVR